MKIYVNKHSKIFNLRNFGTKDVAEFDLACSAETPPSNRNSAGNFQYYSGDKNRMVLLTISLSCTTTLDIASNLQADIILEFG